MLLSQYTQYEGKHFYNSDYWGENHSNNPSNSKGSERRSLQDETFLLLMKVRLTVQRLEASMRDQCMTK